MKWNSSTPPLRSGPLTDEELLELYPGLKLKDDEDENDD